MKEKLVIVGTGFLTNEVVDFIEHHNLYDIVGYSVDREYIKSNEYKGAPVYPLENLEEFIDKTEVKLFVAISWYQNMMGARARKFEELKSRGFHFANLISPSATIYAESVGEGNWIGDNVVLGYKSHIGSNNVLRSNIVIGHYSVVSNHNFMGSQGMIAGHVNIGTRCFIGISATVFNRVSIGNQCVVGGGCVIKQDVPDYSLCVASGAAIIQKDETSIEKYISVSRLQKNK